MSYPQPIDFLYAIWRISAVDRKQSYMGFVGQKDWRGDGSFTEQKVDYRDMPVLSSHDIYFAPHLSVGPRRTRKYAAPQGRWLYADLDAVNPKTDLPENCPTPTCFWETSEGSWQAMWLLDRPVRKNTLEQLNQKLTYFTGADKGGWSLTKYLRVPGSVSHKHTSNGLYKPWRIPLHGPNNPRCSPDPHSVAHFARILDEVDLTNAAATGGTSLPQLTLPPEDAATLLRRRYRPLDAPKRRKPIPGTVRALANPNRTVLTTEDRSGKMYQLEAALLEAGMTPEQTFVVVRACAYNKFRGQRREQRQIWGEVVRQAAAKGVQTKSAALAPKRARPRKSTPPTDQSGPKRSRAVPKRTKSDESDTSDPSEQPPKRIEWVSFSDMLTRATPRPKWLVESIWSDKAHGLLAGDPKTFKSLFTMDLAVSVAHGSKFLGHFSVPRRGPVLIIQEENSPSDVQDRLSRIADSRGVGPKVHTNGEADGTVLEDPENLPIQFLNNQGFNLLDEMWMGKLERKIKRSRPELVVLDPLYLMTPGADENSAAEMTPVLAELLRIKQKYGTGILIVHHFKKPSQGNTSQRTASRMSGTGVFHRWLASALYVELLEKESPTTVRISSEHRSHGSGTAYRVEFDLGTEHDLHYAVKVEEHHADKLIIDDDTPDSDIVDQIVKETKAKLHLDRDRVKAMAKSQTPNGSISPTRKLAQHMLDVPQGSYPVSELAAALNCTESAIKSRARRLGLTVERIATVQHVLHPLEANARSWSRSGQRP